MEFGEESRNFMTPRILSYGWIKHQQIAYELSEGEGFNHNHIFGVSVARRKPGGKTERLLEPVSGVFRNKTEAKQHIKKLQREGLPPQMTNR
jgi:hypothetical protein